ncbi:MAG: hypothetical protein ACOYVF_13185 [Candidatus Zixiibacteriota bacterium]
MTADQGTIPGGGTPYRFNRKQVNDHWTNMVAHPRVAHPVIVHPMVAHSVSVGPTVVHSRVAHLFRGGVDVYGNLTNPTAEAVGHPVGTLNSDGAVALNSEGAPQLAVGAFDSEDNPYLARGHAGVEFNTEYCYLNAATCPDCGQGMVRLGGCFSCPVCGFSSCEI